MLLDRKSTRLNSSHANTINISKGNDDSFFVWNVNSDDTCHKFGVLLLTLSLLVFGIFAYDHYFAFAFNHFTFVADWFD